MDLIFVNDDKCKKLLESSLNAKNLPIKSE